MKKDNKKIIESCDIFFKTHSERSNENKTLNETTDATDATIKWSSITLSNPKESENIDGDTKEQNHQFVTACERQTDDENQIGIQKSSPKLDKKGRPYCTGDALVKFFEEFVENDSSLTNEIEQRVSEEEQENRPYESNKKDIRLESEFNEPKTFLVDDEPSGYENAIKGANGEEWERATQEELKAHEINETWEITERPKSGTTLTARWVFVIKRCADGSIDKFKARLVARGFEQKYGIDYWETFAPVARIETVRTILAISAVYDLEIIQFDVSTAFLNGIVEEEIFLEPPAGVEVSAGKCLKLKKALYGLKQAPRAWNSRLNEVLGEIGFSATVSDQCVYVDQSKSQMILI